MPPENTPRYWLFKILGVLLPRLGRFFSILANSTRPEDLSEEIIARNLRSGGLRGASEGASGGRVTAQRATASIAQVVKEANEDSKGQSSGTGGLPTSGAAKEQALRHMQQDFEDSRKRMDARIKVLQSQERVVFLLVVAAAVFCLGLVLVGAVFYFIGRNTVLAAITEIVGVVSGAGTAVLRETRKELGSKARELEEREEGQTRYLRAIQSALALEGAERDVQLAKTAEWLRNEIRDAKGLRAESTTGSTSESRAGGSGQPAE